MSKLVGFIYQHEDGTVSICSTPLNSEDEGVIQSILNKYETEGTSVRGEKEELSLSDVL